MADRVVHILRVKREQWEHPRLVYIGRAVPRYGLARSVYANPFTINGLRSREKVIAMYEEWAPTQPQIMAALRALPLDVDYVFG